MKVGLRIDADTFRGTRYGVPNLLRLLAGHAISATFFFSVGPDNMGRHLWRLIRPAFLGKMLRSNAPSLYGWDILRRGSLYPGPVIGDKLGRTIRSAAEARHEVGLHAWDHHDWQVHIDRMGIEAIRSHLRKGFNMLTRILGRPPACSAVPGWKCNNITLLEKSRLPFTYNSDCRGAGIFHPFVDGIVLSQPQVPVTLPTYDEAIGCRGISKSNYNEYMVSLLKENGLNVLTVHAEVEGLACFAMFDEFLKLASSRGASFVPLGALLSETPEAASATITKGTIQGREGWISVQSSRRAKQETRS